MNRVCDRHGPVPGSVQDRNRGKSRRRRQGECSGQDQRRVAGVLVADEHAVVGMVIQRHLERVAVGRAVAIVGRRERCPMRRETRDRIVRVVAVSYQVFPFLFVPWSGVTVTKSLRLRGAVASMTGSWLKLDVASGMGTKSANAAPAEASAKPRPTSLVFSRGRGSIGLPIGFVFIMVVVVTGFERS